MKVNILFFGQLTDVTGTTNLVLEDINDTSMLIQQLHTTYPDLLTKKYVIAVNATVAEENTLLTDNCTVALLPPFSGG
ncbi:MAG: MoaD/ThiS family protein [Ferruginibacter sp.]